MLGTISGIIAGLLAGVAGLLAVALVAAVRAALGPVLGLHRRVAWMAATARTATARTAMGGSSGGAEARYGGGAAVEKLPEGRRDAEERLLAA
jgi:hypothetical protein